MSDTKEIKKQIDELHNEIVKALDLRGIMLITPIVLQKHAKIVDLTSQLADISSSRLERQTDKLILLTRTLVRFTCVLVVMTALLIWLTIVLVRAGK